jgi:hypothetical protein
MRLGLKIAILESDQTQRQIAVETGLLSENRLSSIVRGWVEPRDDEKAALAKVLKRPIETLFEK